MLGPHSGLLEVLWIFNRFQDKNKCLALQQNPYFYSGLPALPEAYGGEFRMYPIMSFRHERVSVLTDTPDYAGRVFLETAGEFRAYGNVWVPNDALIFKGSSLFIILCVVFSSSDTLLDVFGNLVGESIVGATIQGVPNLWCFEEPPPSLASRPAISHNRNSPPNMTAKQITSAVGVVMHDWREPIRRMLRSRDVNIRITDKPPSYSALSS